MKLDDGESAFPTPSIEYEYVWMKKSVFLAVLGLDGLAFLFCICCAIAITIYRKHLTFVNTGFALTYIFILGCVMMLMSVPLFGIDSNLANKINIPKACMARIWLLSVGYSLSVGIMIVRVIYTAFMELVREFKSYQITPTVTLFFVTSMAIIDTTVVIAWRWLSPPHKDYVTKEIELVGVRDERRTLVETCNSEKESMLIGFMCFYKGGLLLVALIVSIFKREEEEKRSGDYNQCQMGLLSVLVAGAVGLPVVLSLPYNPNKSFAVGGVVVILEVFFLMIWVKVSKIFNAHKCKKGEALEFGKYSVERSPRCVPCVRPVYGCAYDIKSQGLFNEGYDLDSVVDIKDADPEFVKEADEEDNLA
ncbi:gamma-aminobutyric acid type B receptor subunit 1-like isoform X1, partial [Paramuricea clavata]